jgi:hemoglobin
MTWRRTMGILVAMAALVAGCAGGGMQGDKMAMEKKSLYDRLGGKPAITAVVDDFIGNVAGDTRINKRFANADIPRLKRMLVDQICQASGGPCTYTGASMKDAHKGMKITDAEFNALVEDLVKSLDKFKVGAQEKNDLLGALGGMKPDIVNQ